MSTQKELPINVLRREGLREKKKALIKEDL